MSGPGRPLAGVPAVLENLAGALGDLLARWAARDDSRPQPELRLCAGAALDAIDAMLHELHQARARLLAEIRVSDDAADSRVDALLAERGQDGAR